MRPASIICALILCLCCLPLPCLASCTDRDEARLVKVVALTRHGVRSPTQDAATLALWSSRPWPHWPVKRAHLTPRGAEQISFLWMYLGRSWGAQGLWGAETSRPQPDAVFVHADTDQRTRATARALLRGLGCASGYVTSTQQRDPLFHPAKAGTVLLDAATARSAVRNDLAPLRTELRGPLALLSTIAGPLAPELCRRYGLGPACRLSALPDTVRLSTDGRSIALEGALGIASDMTEIFLLEYAQWPGQNAGWGQVDGRTLQYLLPIHSRVFNLVNRARPVALARGTALVGEIVAALAGQHHDMRANAASLTVFVGHDTNLATVGSLLGLHWQAEGYPTDATPPGAVLWLELWEQGGNHTVRPRFAAMPLQILHAPRNTEYLFSLKPVVAGKDLQFKDLVRLAHQLDASSCPTPQVRPPAVKTGVCR